MIITGMGFVWILLIIWSFTQRFQKMISIVIISLIFQSVSFAYTQTFNISLFEISAIIFMLRYFFETKGKLKLSNIQILMILFWIITVVVSLVDVIVFKGKIIDTFSVWNTKVYYDGTYEIAFSISVLAVLLRLSIFCFVFIIIMSYVQINENKIKNEEIIWTLYISIGIVLVVGIIQYMDVLGINTKEIIAFFHSENIRVADAFYNNYDRLYSTFREPSYCGPWLTAAFFSLLMDGKKNFVKIALMFMILVEIVFSTSSTAVLAFMLMLIVYFKLSKKNMNDIFNIVIITTVIILILVVFPEGKKAIDMFLNKRSSSSGTGRMEYLKLCYKIFFETTGMGVGLQQVQSMTLIGGLLGQIGFIGTLSFILFIYKVLKASHFLRHNGAIYIMLFSILISTEISCSGLLYSAPFWYVLFLWAFDYKNKINQGENSLV